MRFMMMIKADKNYEAGMPPSPELMAAMGKYTEDMKKSGALLATGGLLPSSQGSRIKVSGGKLAVIDGPFAETKELIGGFAIVQAKSKAEALEMAQSFMQLHRDVLGPSWEGECEIRPMFDAADCASQAR